MNMKTLKTILFAAVAAAGLTGTANAEPKQPKWLVLDKFTYQKGVDTVAFEGIDALLLTKLAQSKYKVLDRDAYDTAAREQGFGANVELKPAGYSMRGEVVQMLLTGKSRTIAGSVKPEYVATVSIRVNDLRTQQAYEAETLRVAAHCQTPKDMLVHVVQRTALAILMRDYPPYIMDYDEDDDEITVSYGSDFLNVGEQYEVRRRKEIVDDDTGDTVYKEKTTGVLEITDVGRKTSTAKLVSGKAKKKDVLRFYEQTELTPPVVSAATGEIAAKPGVLPTKKPRIAVAPFISKAKQVNVRGLQIETRNWMDDTVSHLSTALTQCGSFKVLDRSFGPEIDRELNRIVNDPNANPNDVCRLSNKLATDYLVVAEVMFSDVVSPGTDYATGRPLPPVSAVFAEVRFRCVYAPTTEIKWAQTFPLDSMYFGGTAAQFSSTSAASAAQSISAMIQAQLDPAGYERCQKAAEAARKAAEAAAAAQPPAPVAAPSAGVNVGF